LEKEKVQSKVWVVIPTYNEEENIGEIVARIFELRPDVSILVVDDNSVDETQEIVKGMQKNNPRLHLMVRQGKKRGYAPSLIDGFSSALKSGAEFIFQMDADMSHHPKYLPQLIEKFKEADVVCGSRWANGGGTQNWATSRILLSRTASKYVRLMLGLKLADCTAGWIGYRRWVLQKIGLENIRSNGYGFSVEIKYRAKLAGAKFAELPIVFIDRRFGYSKLSKKIIWEAIFLPWKLKLRRFFM